MERNPPTTATYSVSGHSGRAITYEVDATGVRQKTSSGTVELPYASIERVSLRYLGDQTYRCSLASHGGNSIEILGPPWARIEFKKLVRNLHHNLAPMRDRIEFRRGDARRFLWLAASSLLAVAATVVATAVCFHLFLRSSLGLWSGFVVVPPLLLAGLSGRLLKGAARARPTGYSPAVEHLPFHLAPIADS